MDLRKMSRVVAKLPPLEKYACIHKLEIGWLIMPASGTLNRVGVLGTPNLTGRIGPYKTCDK